MSSAAEVVHSRTVYGFWVYLMTDCILFGVLFATFVVLHPNTYNKELFSLPFVLAETLILLVSSFTCGFLPGAMRENNRHKALFWFAVTFLLGAAFVTLELTEFTKLVREGNSWQKSGYFSGFFTLVGTHGFHISVGLLWMIVLMAQIGFRGFNDANIKRVDCFRLFWHFLDVVWIFIFTFVYLLEAM